MKSVRFGVFWSVFSRIQSECWKIRTRITPTTDTFHAVSASHEIRFRYYATFKVRKFCSCSTKWIHVCKKLPLVLDCGQSKYYLEKFNIYIFSILGVAFAVPFVCFFQKLQLLVIKKFWDNFWWIVLLFVWAQKVSQIFKILFQTGDSNSFVLLGAFFSSYVRLKSSCSAEKKISGGIWDTLL